MTGIAKVAQAALLVVAGAAGGVFISRWTAPEPAPVEVAQVAPVPVEPEPLPAIDVQPEPAPSPAPVTRPVRAAPRQPAPAPAPPSPRRDEPEAAPIAALPPPPPAAPVAEEPPTPAPPVAARVAPAEPAPLPPPPPREVTIPAGTLIPVRVVEALSTERNSAGDGFSGTLEQDLVIDGLVIADRGSRVEGRVVEAERAGRVKGTSLLAVQLTQIRSSDGQRVAVNTDAFRVEGETSRRSDTARVATGAAIGAAIGAIAGGGKGAAIGAGAGGAAGTGAVMATRGKDAAIRSETLIRFRLSEPVTMTEQLK